MKYIKTFENTEKLEAGDYIRIKKNSTAPETYQNMVGTVLGSAEHEGYDYRVKLDIRAALFFFKDELEKLTPEEFKQYKFEQDLNKYNL